MTVANYDAPTLGESWPIWLEKATHQITQEVTFWSIATAFVMAVCFALLFGTFQRSVFWKPSAESWHDWFWRVLDIVILAAGVSAVIWSFFWSLGFVLLVLLSKRFGVPTETSALAISFAVLLGHLPKFASNLFGTDTDFEDFVARVGRHSLQDAH